MKIAVIIPTYNEAEGIGLVLDELMETCKKAPTHEWSIVVVDGNSPDGTGDIVETKHQKLPNIHLIREPEKRGIACAYVTGMRYAIDVLKADAFVEFDGDGQHDPKDLLRLVEALLEGADYVVGSRYVRGGAVPKTWALYRKLVSRFGSLYARLLLEVPVHDVTSGLKATRVKDFGEYLPLSDDVLLSRHYAYKIQFLQSMVDLRARIIEVPIVFRERVHDISKNTLFDVVESLRVTAILRLRALSRWRLLRVVAIGGIGFLIQGIVFEILGIQLMFVPASIAALLGGELAILSNFFLNERFSFRDRVHEGTLFSSRLIRFHLVSSGSIFTQWLLIFIAEQVTNGALVLRIVFLAGVLLGFIINYTGYYFFVWNTKYNRVR